MKNHPLRGWIFIIDSFIISCIRHIICRYQSYFHYDLRDGMPSAEEIAEANICVEIINSQYFRIIRRYWDSCFTVYFILATVESRGNLLEVGTCLRRPLEPQQMV